MILNPAVYGEFATGRIARFLGHMAALQLLGMGRPKALPEGPREAGIGQRRGCPAVLMVRWGARVPLRGRIFLRKILLCPSRSRPRASPEGPREAGIGQRRGCPAALMAHGAPTSRCGVAPSCGRHRSSLRGRTIPRHCALPCTPKTAHSTPSNCRI